MIIIIHPIKVKGITYTIVISSMIVPAQPVATTIQQQQQQQLDKGA